MIIIKGRYFRRMMVVAIALAAIFLIVMHLSRDVLKTAAPILAVFISGLIAYGAFLDEKRFEQLYDSRLALYSEMLSEILYVYKLPIIFLNSEADNVRLAEKLKVTAQQTSGRFKMLLIANSESYSALVSLEKKVNEKLYNLILLFTEVNKVGARDQANSINGAFYESLDKSKLSIASIMDFEHLSRGDPVASMTSLFSSKLKIYLQGVIAMSEFNDLVIDLINEMRKDLEIGYFKEVEIKQMKKEFRDSVTQTFEFLGKLLSQLARNNGINIDA